MASYQGPASQDRQQLAAHVAALLGAALQQPCPLSAKSCEAVSDIPRQRELPWSAHSLGWFFSRWRVFMVYQPERLLR